MIVLNASKRMASNGHIRKNNAIDDKPAVNRFNLLGTVTVLEGDEVFKIFYRTNTVRGCMYISVQQMRISNLCN